MTVTRLANAAQTLSESLAESGFSPFFGTPCGILAPLYAELEQRCGLMTIPREDNAVGIAAGAALAGKSPVVLMQNSGFGLSVNAIASLVAPYRIPMLFVIGMRGLAPDTTEENSVMGRLTELVLCEIGVPTVHLAEPDLACQVRWGQDLVVGRRHSAALLVPPTLLGWRP